MDEPDGIISLCRECHNDYHAARITKCALIELMEKYILKRLIRDKYREFHDCE